MDCGKAYKGFWEKLEREKYAKISPEQLAGVSRLALRAYDACQAGDELDAKALFDTSRQDEVLIERGLIEPGGLKRLRGLLEHRGAHALFAGGLAPQPCVQH